MKKIIAFVLTAVMVLALAAPAFAVGHQEPEIVVTYGNPDGYNVPGSTIKYELTLFDDDASTIKIGNKKIDIKEFKKNSDGTFTYKGYLTLGMTDTSLRFYVYDMDQAGSATFEKTITFKVDPTRPVVSVTALTTDTIFKFGVITILATDNYGLEKIAVNGKVVADKDDIGTKKTYGLNYEVVPAGTYVVVVTDVAGNISVCNVTYSADGKVTSDNLTAPVPGYLWTGDYMSGLAAVYKDNPQLYYFLRMFQRDNGNVEGNWILWYLFSQGYSPFNPIDVTDIPTTDAGTGLWSNWYYFYRFLMMNKDLDDADKMLYYTLFYNRLGQIDNNSVIWYLLRNGELDMSPQIFYYLMSGNTDPLASVNINDNYFAYQYFFGNLLNFVCGPEITDFTKDGVLYLTAPKVSAVASASYKWQKLVNSRWTDIADDSETIAVTPVTGDKYRVILSSDYYYRWAASDVFTVNSDMLDNDEVTPVPTPAPVPAEDDGSFTADDITINGVKANTIRIKVGERLVLVPNVNGYWVYDTTAFTGAGNTLAVLTAQKTGTFMLLFTGFDGHGHTATKPIYVHVVE